MKKKEYYNEVEAAQLLRISVPELHSILAEHVFKTEPMPVELSFTQADITLMRFWAQNREPAKILAMPPR